MVERCDFDLQLTSQTDGQTLRPDMRVNLAEGKHVFVDSKVPLSAFLDAAETEDDQQRAAHLDVLRPARPDPRRPALRQEVLEGGESPEFVVLFLPSEAFFAAALEQMPDLYEYAAHRDVVLATPTTLIGMLRAVSYGWKQAALAETAAEVFRLGRELHERLGLMGNRFDKLGRAIRTSVNAYNETVATVEGTVLVQARRFRDLKVTEQRADAARQHRRAGAADPGAELVDDAVQVEPMVGRAPTTARQPPEAEALWRADPDVDELSRTTLERDATRGGHRPRGLERLESTVAFLDGDAYLRFMGRFSTRSRRCSPTGRAARRRHGARRGLRPGRAHRGAGRRYGADRVLAVDPSPGVRRGRRENGCPASTCSRARPSSCPTTTTRSTPRSPSSSSTSWRTRSPGSRRCAGSPGRAAAVAACVWDHVGESGPLVAVLVGGPRPGRPVDDESQRAGVAGGSPRTSCSAEAGLGDVRDGRAST